MRPRNPKSPRQWGLKIITDRMSVASRLDVPRQALEYRVFPSVAQCVQSTVHFRTHIGGQQSSVSHYKYGTCVDSGAAQRPWPKTGREKKVPHFDNYEADSKVELAYHRMIFLPFSCCGFLES